jgi:hypothetical protein
MEVLVTPAEPHRVEQEGNHQAAVIGTRLAAPLGLRVRDRFGNPVGGATVTFAVREGDGRLGGGKERVQIPTDASGLASVPFVVSSSAGQNLVTADVDGTDETLQFVAYATAG